MPHISYENRQISFKIVYYGPGMGGKTTSLAYIHGTLAADRRGELVMLNTTDERTLFFDFFPLELGQVSGYSVRFNLYTVPGQIYYEASRRLILDGADAVVFVADSQPARLEDNLVSFRMMQDNLRSYDLDPATFPLVIQYNKRDCAGPIPLGSLEREFGLDGVPVFESIATSGAGVMEAIRKASQMVVERFDL